MIQVRHQCQTDCQGINLISHAHENERKKINNVNMVDRNKYEIQILLPPKIDPSVTMMTVEEKPDVTYNDIGGCKEQIEKMREVVELPMLHLERFVKLGIDPPKGVLCYGLPVQLLTEDGTWSYCNIRVSIHMLEPVSCTKAVDHQVLKLLRWVSKPRVEILQVKTL